MSSSHSMTREELKALVKRHRERVAVMKGQLAELPGDWRILRGRCAAAMRGMEEAAVWSEEMLCLDEASDRLLEECIKSRFNQEIDYFLMLSLELREVLDKHDGGST